MDYEKKYKEALERAKQLSKELTVDDIVEQIFPELKESEDEKIRKALIEYYSFDKDGGSHALDNITPKQIVAWLEKQGEKEINDNDIAVLENWENAVKENKEKWQLSDWFVEATSLLVRKVEYMGQGIKNDSNKTMLNACINALRNVGHQHLANWLEKQDEKKPIEPQQDMLSQEKYAKAVDECIYGEQKQNINIQINSSEYINDMGGNGCYLKNTTQNPAWSEEGEKILNLIIARLHSHPNVEAEEYDKDYHWLKSLRPKSNQEVDEQIETIAMHLDNCGDTAMAEILRSCNLRPQNTWKPSDEQMKALKEACDEHWELDGLDPLYTLYEDLKKLKG